MSKSFFLKFGFILLFIVVAGLWLASIIQPELFGAFNIQWAIVIVAGGAGLFYLLRAFGKNLVAFKKFYVIVGTVLIGVAILVLINIFAIEDAVVIPILAILACVGMLVMLLVTGGKKWDQADNKNVGYKDYAHRKAEAERHEAREARKEEREERKNNK